MISGAGLGISEIVNERPIQWIVGLMNQSEGKSLFLLILNSEFALAHLQSFRLEQRLPYETNSYWL